MGKQGVSPAVPAGGGAAARGPIEHSTEYPAKEWTESTTVDAVDGVDLVRMSLGVNQMLAHVLKGLTL